MNFWSYLTATFIGATLAFLFALLLYLYQRKSNEGQYLSFVIAYMSNQISAFYSLKKNIIEPRKIELSRLFRQFEDLPPSDNITKLEIREISQFILNTTHSPDAVNLDKLSFLADYDPNLFALINTALNADRGINEIVKECNLQIQHAKQNFDMQNIWLLMLYNKNLVEQVDFALTLFEHGQEQLISFSKHEFKHFVKISGSELSEDYKEYQPQIKTSWSKLQYEPRMEGFKTKVKKFGKRLLSCL